MSQQSLTIRLQAQDTKGALVLQNIYGCETPGEAVHASLDLFALMSEELLEAVQESARRNARAPNQQIVVLLREAMRLQQSHIDWSESCKDE